MLYKTNNPHGGDIYNSEIRLDYSANTNPLGTPKGVLDAIEEALPSVHRYPDPCCRKLVRAISEAEKVREDYILCGNGAAELIYAYCEAVSPKSAIEAVPTFSEYSQALEKSGCTLDRFMLSQSRDFELGGDFAEYVAEKKPDAVFLCNPNNPTGRTVSPQIIEKILCICKEKNIRLFIDECFLDLTDHGISAKEYLEKYPQLFILKAFTKSYGMAGIRLGYCMCADTHLLMRMSKITQPWNVSLLAQEAGEAALKERLFLEKTREIIGTERQWLKEELEKQGFYVCPSEANYILFRAPSGIDEKLKSRGILIRNCSNFHGLTDGWYRTAVRLHEENKILLDAIAR